MDNVKTGKFIAERRKELGYNQKDLAEKLNITDKAVSKWETGRSAPDVSLLMPLAEILNVSVAEILNGEKISQEEISTASNEIIVKSLKKSRSKTVLAIILALIAIICLLGSKPAHHYFSTINEDNFTAIRRQTEKTFRTDNLEFVARGEKSNKIAYLFSDNKKSYIMLYEKDEMFENRISLELSHSSPCEYGVDFTCYGYNGETIFVMYNANVPDGMTEYKFEFRGNQYICPINEDYILDIFIDKDYSFTNPNLNMERNWIDE